MQLIKRNLYRLAASILWFSSFCIFRPVLFKDKRRQIVAHLFETQEGKMFRLCSVLAVLITVNEQMVQGSRCYRDDGRPGRCMRLERCNVSLNAFEQCGLRPEKCDTGTQHAEVCCPNKPWIIPDRPIDYSCNENDYNRKILGALVNVRTLYPHVAAIGYSDPPYKWNCGGTLIHLRYVLTAAHCFREVPKAVLLGASDLWDKHDPHAQLIEVQSFLQHEEYQERTKNKYKDIGLVYLRRSIEITAYVSPACLLTYDIKKYDEVTTVGWGMGSDYYEGVTDERRLREARMSVVKCKKTQEAVQFKKYVICTWDQKDAACSGDSGGPLQVFHDGRLYVMGVFSFGSGTCTSSSQSRFIRLTPFLDWIEEKVWTAERCAYNKSLPQ